MASELTRYKMGYLHPEKHERGGWVEADLAEAALAAAVGAERAKCAALLAAVGRLSQFTDRDNDGVAYMAHTRISEPHKAMAELMEQAQEACRAIREETE